MFPNKTKFNKTIKKRSIELNLIKIVCMIFRLSDYEIRKTVKFGR